VNEAAAMTLLPLLLLLLLLLVLLHVRAANHTCFNQSAPDWFARNAPNDLYHRITPADMVANVTAWHREVS
jgi:hypothetical protein